MYSPKPGFLKGLRKLATEHNALLIFDEVMTGFRLSKGGAAALYGVTPDLVCFGKVIGEDCRLVPSRDHGNHVALSSDGPCVPGGNVIWQPPGNVCRLCIVVGIE